MCSGRNGAGSRMPNTQTILSPNAPVCVVVVGSARCCVGRASAILPWGTWLPQLSGGTGQTWPVNAVRLAWLRSSMCWSSLYHLTEEAWESWESSWRPWLDNLSKRIKEAVLCYNPKCKINTSVSTPSLVSTWVNWGECPEEQFH
jgi:hypothetical protein